MKTILLMLAVALFTATPVSNTFAQTAKTTTANPMSDEWKTYKADQEKMIASNQKMIDELKKRQASPASGKIEDKEFQKRIDELQQKNNTMKTRLATFQYDNSKWAQFKREYSHDMDELGQAIKDIGKKNTK